MTIERAIEQLKEIPLPEGLSIPYMRRIYTAIDLAIKALEQQPCEDCISRTALLSRIDAERKHLLDLNMDGAEHIIVHHARRFIEDMPSVTPQQPRWIPVSERLPEKQDCYLVTTKWKGNYSGDVYIETNMAVYREKQKEWDCVDVIAWMPLPQPYKAESEGEE